MTWEFHKNQTFRLTTLSIFFNMVRFLFSHTHTHTQTHIITTKTAWENDGYLSGFFLSFSHPAFFIALLLATKVDFCNTMTAHFAFRLLTTFSHYDHILFEKSTTRMAFNNSGNKISFAFLQHLKIFVFQASDLDGFYYV